jgi:hypothetical protein
LYFCNQRLKTIPSHISCHAAFSPYFPSEMFTTPLKIKFSLIL